MAGQRNRNQDEWVSLRAPAPLVARILEVSRETGVSKAEVARSALIAAFFPDAISRVPDARGVLAARKAGQGEHAGA